MLHNSCIECNIDFIRINTEDFDYTNNHYEINGNILYKVSTTTNANILEKYLFNSEALTFYYPQVPPITKPDNVIEATIVHAQNNIRIPKTIYSVTTDKTRLNSYIDYLGGFPIIIKLAGGSHGIGVIKIDSFSSLISILDVLTQDEKPFILKKYINSPSHARLIVLGDEVIDSIEYKTKKDDFRTNIGEPDVIGKTYNNDINKLAVKAMNILGWKFGGVDIIIKDNTPYLLEVNMPCFFGRTQNTTGTDISGMMIDHLVAKTKNDG